MRRVGVLMGARRDDPEVMRRSRLFGRGWSGAVGRRAATSASTFALRPAVRRGYASAAKSWYRLPPDVIIANGTGSRGLQRATRTVPIVFVCVPDPVGAGFVDSLARPGGNLTGVLQFEAGIAAKWLELLKEVAPRVERVASRDPKMTAHG